MEQNKEMPFGVKNKVGNFTYLKHVRVLSGKEVAQLRDLNNIPQEARKHLQRKGLPYITVSTIGGGWSISYVCGSEVYRFIEHEHFLGKEGERALHNLFVMLYGDTTFLGDVEYWQQKQVALQGFLDRMKARKVEKEEDDKELEGMKAEEEAKAAIIEMAKKVKEEE